MTAPSHGKDHGAGEHHEDEHIHEASHYIKIWAILCVLLIISFVGPIIADAIKLTGWTRTSVVLLTAFGIALVKAYFVCAEFMHLKIEKGIASMIVASALICMGLYFAGAAPDVLKHEGQHWSNVAAKAEVVRRIEREGENGEKLAKEVHERAHGGGAAHGEATHGEAKPGTATHGEAKH